MGHKITRALALGAVTLGLGLSAVSAFAAGGKAAGGGATGGGSASGGGSSTGGGGTATGGGGTATGGGGGTKAACVNTLSITGSATESLAGNAFTAVYAITSCQSKTSVAITVTDVATGAVVYVVPDTTLETVFWTLPYTLTSYRVDARAYATISGVMTTVATASTVVDTLDPLPCTPTVVESTTSGWIGAYPAIWAHHDAQDCGLGGTVHLTITNTRTGVVERDLVTPASAYTLDYEGSVVPYATPYHVQADLHSRSGELLASSSDDVVSVG